MSDTHTALIIDDEPDIRELIAMSLDRIGLNTYTAANLEEARNLLDNYTFDVCLTDMKLPDGDGVEFVKHILQVQPSLPVAVVTAHGNMNAAVEAMKNGAFDFVSKPVDLGLLRSLVTQAISLHRRADLQGMRTTPKPNSVNGDESVATNADVGSMDLPQLPASVTPAIQRSSVTLEQLSGQCTTIAPDTTLPGEDKLVGQSDPMRQLRTMIGKVARTNAPVWITGESGTGKELIARIIHENGPRADEPFIAINCGAIPSELMESEMFGHRKGSFTGAHNHHDGLFQRANGGTLFLDEVAELPLHMQVKLLRAIQERSIRPVGSSDELSVNVRILSASHKDLGKEVDSGRFRHDLYYRLNVICIRSPSLRERREDVAEIAGYILRSLSTLEGSGRRLTLSSEAESLLCSYSFPGNVRELENILERAVALSDDTEIHATDLNIDTTGSEESSLPASGKHFSSTTESEERQNIVDMLTQTRWNRKAAAEQLGMSYRQLRYRIQQYGIDTDSGENPLK